MLEFAHRAVCYECHKPKTLCVCSRVSRVDNRTNIIVVQHPRERLHPIGTARFAKLGLARVRVEVAWDAGARDESRPPWVPENAALLYPSPDARDLAELSENERPAHLVVLDGTWHTARTLFRDKTWLHSLPRYRLSPSAPSRYRIRREPRREFVSTLEAIVEALRVLEPETRGFDALLEAFDEMIDAQLVFIRRGTGAPRAREKRPLAWRKIPRALVEDFERLVVVYAEFARPHPRGARSLVQLAAVAPSTSATFERLLVTEPGPPTAAHLAHMQLPAEAFEHAVLPESFRKDWKRFLEALPQPPLLAAWNQSTLDLLAVETESKLSWVSLKSAYRNTHGAGTGSLDEISVERFRRCGFGQRAARVQRPGARPDAPGRRNRATTERARSSRRRMDLSSGRGSPNVIEAR